GSAEEAAARLGFAQTAPLTVVAFELTNAEPGIDELQRERLVDLLVVHCEATSRQTGAVTLGQVVYALLRLAEQVQSHAETRLGLALLAAVGPVVETLREVPRARREVERVLGVLR